MTSRDTILQAIRRNLPQPAVSLPSLPDFGGKTILSALGYKEHLTKLPEVLHASEGNEPLAAFQRQLVAMGGRWFALADGSAVRKKVEELFPSAKVVCSAVPEFAGTCRVQVISDPHDLNNVDVGVVRSRLGVAEAGAVWLTESELVVNALGVLAQHLVVLLDPSAIVRTMHDAYASIDLARSPYGVFMAGPSATGDIEGDIIHGAQGARSLTVLLVAPEIRGKGSV